MCSKMMTSHNYHIGFFTACDCFPANIVKDSGKPYFSHVCLCLAITRFRLTGVPSITK